ncbi:MAG TPA: penicillin-binding protein 2 [Candidatus Megaira endosymbiont of Nemacystus decipiens]|nr:penicillin-binding protein 2 [Candidatus Megaera endosymbiont of Nemacystus decipiens]
MKLLDKINELIQLSNRKSSILYWRISPATIRLRITILIIMFILFFIIIFIRIVSISLFPSNYSNNSSNASIKRLDIIDRNSNLLAVTLPSSSLYAVPKDVLLPEMQAQKLVQIFPTLNKNDLLKKLKSDKNFVWIKRDISPLEKQKIYNLGLVGFNFEREQKRFYTYGNLLSHVIGYVGRDMQGLAGVEKYYNKFLTMQSEIEDRSDFGDNLQLSIDVRIQNILDDEISKTIEKFSAKGAAAIVVNPKNGEVLGLVSKPNFDPHNPGKAEDDQLFNIATQGVYELGSSMKGLTVAIGIDSKATSIYDVYDLSYMKVGGFQIKDTHKATGWHPLPYLFLKSSNIGMVQIIFEIGKDNFMKYLKKLGMLDTLKIDLQERARPLFPPTANITDLGLSTISYGYGISVSPAHVVQAMIPVVNGGVAYPITLLKQKNQTNGTRVLNESTSKDLRKLLRLGVAKGTGKKAEIKGYYVGGKTGTANIAVSGKYDKKKRVSSFMGILPATDPEYLIYVVLNQPVGIKETFGFAGGAWTAAPTVSAILKRIIALVGMKPLDPNSKEVINLNDIEYDIGNET